MDAKKYQFTYDENFFLLQWVDKDNFKTKGLTKKINEVVSYPRRGGDLSFSEIIIALKAWLPKYAEFLLKELQHVDKVTSKTGMDLKPKDVQEILDKHKITDRQKIISFQGLGSMKPGAWGPDFPQFFNLGRKESQPELNEVAVYTVYKSFLEEHRNRVLKAMDRLEKIKTKRMEQDKNESP